MATAEVDDQVPSAVGEPRGRRSEASEPTAPLALVVAPDRLIQHRLWEVIVSGTVARVSEISARSDTSFEDAVNLGLSRANATLRGVTSGWIKEQSVDVENGKIVGYRVNLLVTFVLE